MGPLGKACKKCTADQQKKNDENSPVAPTLIRDGSVGTAHNSCQIDIGCQWLQAWDHLARHARNAKLITSRRMMEMCQSGQLLSVISEWRSLAISNRVTANGRFYQRLPGWSSLPSVTRMVLVVNPACVGWQDSVYQTGNVRTSGIIHRLHYHN